MLQQYWRELPEWFRATLLPGTVGAFRQMGLASRAVACFDPDKNAAPSGEKSRAVMLTVARGLLLAAWEEDPLNGDLARQVLSFDQQAPWLPLQTKAMLLELVTSFSRPENLRYYQRVAQQGDCSKIQTYLEGERAKAPDNIYWLQQILAVGELYGELEWALHHVQAQWPAVLPANGMLKAMTESHLLAISGRHDDVIALSRMRLPEAVDERSALGTPLLILEREAHSRWVTGDREGAHALWGRLVKMRPWRVNLLMRFYDSVMGNDAPCIPDMGRTAALLYSWNKADDLDAALQSLAPSASELSRIIAINNGSTDATGDVLNAWTQRLGGRMQTIHLPVNIGAPAARNWLKNLPEVTETEFVAYLDDDAILPRNWLHHFARAVHAYPAASVWGGKILDYHAPHIVQSADLHLSMKQGTDEEIDTAFHLSLAHAVPFNVTDMHAQVSDTGGFDYIRPCISVTGCCHLFRTADLMESGDFSLSLSPSQYDDLEHDLRMATQGRHCAYTGFLPVKHMKRTGKATRMTGAQYGNGLGNKYKLHAMHSRADVEALLQAQARILEQDLLNKAEQLDSFMQS